MRNKTSSKSNKATDRVDDQNRMSYLTFFVCLALLAVWLVPKFFSKNVGGEKELASKSATPMPRDAATKQIAARLNSLSVIDMPPSDLTQNLPSSFDPQYQPRTVLKTDEIRKLEDPSAPLSSVCNKIRSINEKDSKLLTQKPFAQRMSDSVLGQADDPAFESVQPVLRYVFTQPKLKGILGGAYARGIDAQKAYDSISSHRKQLEYILDRSYLLFMLSRSIEQKPSLALDPQVTQYCMALEGQLNGLEHSNYDELKESFRDFLATVNVDPDSIDYDPGYKSDLQLEKDGNSYSYNVGWLRKVNVPL